MKIIRWKGLIAFIVVTGVIAGVIVFFAESYIKDTTELHLSEANGAKVELDDIGVSLVPFSISVSNLQVTDPQRPMINSVQIKQIKMAVSIGDLLLRKLNIDDMSIDGVRIDTPRSSSGKISKVAKSTDEGAIAEESDFEIPEVELPDVKELLEKEPLNTEKLIADLDTDISNTRNQWQATKEEMGDKQRWDKYDADYAKIQKDYKGNFKDKLKAVKSAKDLSKALKQEVEKVKQAKKQFKTDIDRIDDSFEQVKEAPGDDIRRIKQKYQLDDISSGNVTQLLFGSQTAEYVALAKKWYERVKPYIESDEEELPEEIKVRGKGQDIVFREFDPKPNFYVRVASISAEIPRGNFAGEITDISSDQSVNKKPTMFQISGVGLKNREQEKISGEINYIDKKNGFSKLDYIIDKYQVVDYSLSKSEKLSLAISSGLMDLGLNLVYQNGGLSGTTHADLTEVVFESAKPVDGGSLASMMSDSFSDISDFNVNADFKGSLSDMDLSLSSDLDNKIGEKFKSRIKQRTKQFNADLEQGIRDKLKEPMDKVESKRQQLDQIKADVDKKEEELNKKIANLKSKIKF